MRGRESRGTSPGPGPRVTAGAGAAAGKGSQGHIPRAAGTVGTWGPWASLLPLPHSVLLHH